MFDKHTGCYVAYNKKYNISGYGTKKRAIEMFKEQVDEILIWKDVVDNN